MPPQASRGLLPHMNSLSKFLWLRMCRCRRTHRATEIWSWQHRCIGDKTIMRTSREQILQDMYQILGQLAEDWDYSGSIAEGTLFRTDMGLESLDVVVLAASVQDHYDKVLPFN